MDNTARKQATSLPRLGAQTLAGLPKAVQRPTYDYSSISVGIAHISLGAFHRSHQAVYTDEALSKHGGNWGICGIGAMASDEKLISNLKSQDGLYSVLTRGQEGSKARVIGAMRDATLLPDNTSAVLNMLDDEKIKIFSLTITEKGYCHNPQTGLLDPNHPLIAHDLKNRETPKSAIGVLYAALRRRQLSGKAPFTVLSCDNLPGNGHKTQAILNAYARLADDKTAQWIEQNVAFPNTMVDRITPVTTAEDIQSLADQFGYEDPCMVTCEPFLQWILEDKFTAGRPAWETAGAQFVSDVYPYELAKIRLLNVSHTVFAYPAYLMNYVFVSDGAADPLLAKYVRHVMDHEITPTLLPVAGLDLDSYKTTIINRFANPAIKDTWERICSDGSQKIANQLLPIIRECMAQGRSYKGLAFLLAAWFRYLNCTHENGQTYALNDPMADRLMRIAQSLADNDVKPLLAVSEIFGTDLPQNQAFVQQIQTFFNEIKEMGLKQALASHYKV